MNYDFLNLSSIEFERLCHDLLEPELGFPLELFSDGADGGIDLRREENGQLTVVQCKRYADFDKLIASLRKETGKVNRLGVNRYLVATAVPITVQRKEKIRALFAPYLRTVGDIYGRDELNALLRKYPAVEKAHPKLWFTSAAVLESIMNRGQHNKTAFLLDQIRQEQQLLVVSPYYEEAVRKLEFENLVVLSGAPGIGKSTLARLLCSHYILQGFEPISILKDVEEGYDEYMEGKRQVILFDDFLGSNFYKRLLTKNEEERLVRFIDKITGNPDKKLIMTTREYVFRQAENSSEAIKLADLNISKCLMNMERVSFEYKSQLLYNHLFFSALPSEYLVRLVDGESYLEVIEHDNFNPRTIRLNTDFRKIKHIAAERYMEHFVAALKNPQTVWEHAFDVEISSYGKYVLYLLLIADHPVTLDEMELALESLLAASGELKEAEFSVRYRKALIELTDTFIQVRQWYESEAPLMIRFDNPSVQDFLIHRLLSDRRMIRLLVRSAVYFESLFYFDNQLFAEGPFKADAELRSLLADKLISEFDRLRLLKNSRLNSTNVIGTAYFMLEHRDNAELCEVLAQQIQRYPAEYSIKGHGYVQVAHDLVGRADVDADRVLRHVFQGIADIPDIILFLELERAVPPEFERFAKGMTESHREFLQKLIDQDVANELYEPVVKSLPNTEGDLRRIERRLGIPTREYREDLVGVYIQHELAEGRGQDVRLDEFGDVGIVEIIRGAFYHSLYQGQFEDFLLWEQYVPEVFGQFLVSYREEIKEHYLSLVKAAAFDVEEAVSFAARLGLDEGEIAPFVVRKKAPLRSLAEELDLPGSDVDHGANFLLDLYPGHWNVQTERTKKKTRAMFQSLVRRD
ncbi:restriction endonuclease [Cohnella sp.]|uniref:nSTAND3 domain-containing NTPase n=1 Tax=Cohnella sp. TaxID=1883426 RepID=UPI0035666A78